jgi:hypothetical protein
MDCVPVEKRWVGLIEERIGKRRKKDSILTVLNKIRWKSAGIVPRKVLLIGKLVSSQPLIIGKPSSCISIKKGRVY